MIGLKKDLGAEHENSVLQARIEDLEEELRDLRVQYRESTPMTITELREDVLQLSAEKDELRQENHDLRRDLRQLEQRLEDCFGISS